MHQREVKAVTFTCSYCGETNHTTVDPSQGKNQQYIEDCQICCQPNTLSVHYDKFSEQYNIQARPGQ